MCRSRTNRAARAVLSAVPAVGLGLWLAGCSDIYLDRRETIALDGGDAVAANEVSQMVDPWPRYSGNKNIPANGQRMQAAMQRYRTNTVFPPISATTSDVEIPPAAGIAGAAVGGTQTAASPAAPAAASAAAAVSSQ